MNILLISFKYPPYTLSGPARTAGYLAEAILKKGHKVTVITSRVDKELESEERDRLKIHRLKIPTSTPEFISRLFFLKKLKTLFKSINFKEYSILHILDAHESIFLTKHITNKIPTIVSINEYYTLITSKEILNYPCSKKQLPFRYFYHLFLKSLTKKSLNLASLIIPNSKFLANKLKEELNLPENKLKVIYKGIDLSKFKSKFNKDKYTSHNLLFIGFNTERKGLIYLLKALPSIIEKYPNTILTVIGRKHPSFNNFIKKNNLENKINFIEQVPSNKIPDYYSKANIFVLPSILENLAQTLLEAMATNTPVIATDIGANSEGLTKGTGILVKPKNPEQISEAVITILSSPSLAKKMGETGRKHIERNFNKEKMINEIIKLYMELK